MRFFYKFFSTEITCSQMVPCAMRPPVFLFVLPKRKTAPRREASPLGRPVEERKGRQRDQLLYSSNARHRDRRRLYSSGTRSMASQNIPSRVQERGIRPVRSTKERQQTAWFQATPYCASGDPGFDLGFPAVAWSPEETSSGCLS